MATGWGLDANVKEAYQFLVENYERNDGGERDRIYIFGFSRGAYSACVLSGFIHTFGLMEARNLNLLDYAYRAYKRIGSSGEDAFAEMRLFERIMRPDRPPVRLLGLFDTVASVIESGRTLPRLRSHAHILDTFPVPEGMEVLGVECGEQRRHTLATGARMIDMNRARLGHRLVERGLASVRPGRPIPVLLDYIPVDVLEQIKKDEATDYDLGEVCELFGVHRNIAGRLARAGFLGTRSFEDTGTYRFERDDVWKLKHRLFGTVATRSLGTDTHLPLFDAARQFRLPIEALIHYCCNETLKLKHPPSSRRLLTDLLVPIDELKRHIEPKRSEGLLHKDAAKTLHVDRQTISELVAAGKLVEKSIHIPYADHSISYITVESLRAFRADYISLANLALSVDREPGPYAQYLAARGIRPCVDIASSSRIYKRTDFSRKKD